MHETLLLNAALLAVAGVIYATVGYVTSRRRVEGDAHLAASLFSLWWYLLGAITAEGALYDILGFSGVTDIGIYVALLHLTLIALIVAFWALVYYFVFLFTGSRRSLLAVSVFFAVCYLFAVYYVTARQPTSVEITDWAVSLHYTRDGNPIAGGLLVLALIVPPVAGAIGYARLFFRVTDPMQRYRIGLVSVTIIAWFGAGLVIYAAGLGNTAWWTITNRVLGVVAALLILAAYRPPAFVRRLLRPIEEREAAA